MATRIAASSITKPTIGCTPPGRALSPPKMVRAGPPNYSASFACPRYRTCSTITARCRDWLQRIWAPQAERLGLRYVAHVLQPHTEDDLGLLLRHNPFAGKFELQFFTTLADATSWLRDCQQLDAQRDQAPYFSNTNAAQAVN